MHINKTKIEKITKPNRKKRTNENKSNENEKKKQKTMRTIQKHLNDCLEEKSISQIIYTHNTRQKIGVFCTRSNFWPLKQPYERVAMCMLCIQIPTYDDDGGYLFAEASEPKCCNVEYNKNNKNICIIFLMFVGVLSYSFGFEVIFIHSMRLLHMSTQHTHTHI